MKTIRHYALTDSQLIQATDALLDVAREDLASLIPFGITSELLDQIQAQRMAFLDLESDVLWRGKLRLVTQQKAQARKQLHQAIKTLMLHVSIKIGDDSPEYDRFGTAHLARQTDHDLLRTAKLVIDTALENQSTLSLPTDNNGQFILLQQIADCRVFFDQLIDQQLTVIRRREQTTQKRCQLGNDLYKNITLIAKVGKIVFAHDLAHANDYRIKLTIKSKKKIKRNTR